jgi:hypothetical protein
VNEHQQPADTQREAQDVNLNAVVHHPVATQHEPSAVLETFIASAPLGYVTYFAPDAGDAPLFALSSAVAALANECDRRVAVDMQTMADRRRLSIYLVR